MTNLKNEELADWLREREANARRIASGKQGADRAGWLEDAEFFRQAVDAYRRGFNQGLEVAAKAVEGHDQAGRDWVRGSLWDTLSREAGARIRAHAQGGA